MQWAVSEMHETGFEEAAVIKTRSSMTLRGRGCEEDRITGGEEV